MFTILCAPHHNWDKFSTKVLFEFHYIVSITQLSLADTLPRVLVTTRAAGQKIAKCKRFEWHFLSAPFLCTESSRELPCVLWCSLRTCNRFIESFWSRINVDHVCCTWTVWASRPSQMFPPLVDMRLRVTFWVGKRVLPSNKHKSLLPANHYHSLVNSASKAWIVVRGFVRQFPTLQGYIFMVTPAFSVCVQSLLTYMNKTIILWFRIYQLLMPWRVEQIVWWESVLNQL